ncbi:hypothetical protein P280DRAFT_269070 [Massarina eburnea CBS 473.64]|uniref:Uncharacterized protein n=1 Tax=Massarina eburnea CBS 473.64 TaxID=1395130 RepID=A0A6A6S5S1_9PLEO|nr:hypothetical protein P280DRAFT_269070 [Massarina eburnea CBS 473.64]
MIHPSHNISGAIGTSFIIIHHHYHHQRQGRRIRIRTRIRITAEHLFFLREFQVPVSGCLFILLCCFLSPFPPSPHPLIIFWLSDSVAGILWGEVL